jgi:hypothetical protein
MEASNVSGLYVEKRSLWIFPQEAVKGELKQKMRFERGWLNTVYSITVCPTADLIAEID